MNALALANHLWQSTLFAAAMGLMTLAFRRNAAAVRHALWLAASIKFLVPFAALMALGSHLGLRAPVRLVQHEVVVATTTALPLSPFDASPMTSAPVSSLGAAALPWLAVALWVAGSLLVLGTWWVRWRRVAAIARAASIVECGDEVDTLRRVERRVGVRRPITLVASDAAMEPGVFGIVRPVLLWSATIGRHLNGEQVETIFAHELSHVRRRDNLAAAIHMVVEAMLWFHPLVWWIGTRLVDERERACDEAVLVSGHRPEVYAESILKACRLYVESPLPCVAGVTGSDLRKRIERIMSNSTTERLTRWRRLLLTACVLAPLAAPVLLGAASTPRKRVEISSVRMFGLNAPAAAAASQAGPTQSSQQFEVASIKPNKSNDGRVMIGVQPGGRFTATNVTLKMLIRNAYQLQDFQIAGGPDWMSSDHFDVVAKAEGGDDIGDPFRAEKQGEPSRGQLMLRQLLEERFKLQTHKEDRSLPIYALVLAHTDGKLGPQLHKSETDCDAERAAGRGRGPMRPDGPPQPDGGAIPCGIRMAPGNMVVGGSSFGQFANTLGMFVGRVVVDRTGLAGAYDFNLTWTPDNMPNRPPGAPEAPIDPNGPSIFTALQEQLGLKLDSQKGPVSVLVIDRAEHPDEN